MSVRPLFVCLSRTKRTARVLAELSAGEFGRIVVRRFPDGETYLRYDDSPSGRPVVVVENLHRPDGKVAALLFAAAAARDLGAAEVGLVCPYLAYMRQDRRFRPGEAVTSRYFAQLLSSSFDWLVTVDPHLHRYASMDEIYSIPTRLVHAAPLVSAWIRREVERPLLVGPDMESEQWVSEVAAMSNAPYVALRKTRRGDRDVEITVPDIERWMSRTPILVDDIISTGRTMIETVKHLLKAGLPPPICIGIHGIFASKAYDELTASGAKCVVTTNAVPHPSNAIDLSPLLADCIRSQLARPG